MTSNTLADTVVGLSSNSLSAQVPASVTVLAGTSSATFSITTSTVSANTPVTISALYNSVTQTAALNLVAPPSLQYVGVSPSTVTGGQSSTGTVTLTGNALADTVVGLSSNSLSAQVPASVTVLAGTASATFSITTSGVSVATPATIQASYSGVTQTATLNLVALPSLQSVAVSPSTVTGGQPSTGTITLTSAAPAGGAVVSLSSSNISFAQVPSGGVTVPAGATSATFTITTTAVGALTPITISAVYNGGTQTATLSVAPAGAFLQFVTVNPSSVSGGLASTGTVTLLGVSATPTTVALSSNDPAAQVPASVTVPANSSSVQFNIASSSVAASTPVTISGSYNGVTASSTLTLTPPIVATSTYALSISIGSDRSSGILLQGATLMGNAFVYTSPATQPANFNPTGVTGVCYWLDNTAMSGTATHCESAVPYDFASTGATVSVANPWDTTAVADGTHTITQKVTLSNGTTEVDTSTFTIQNNFSTAIGSGHYEYAFVDRSIYVYSLDNNFQLVKHVNLPQTNGVRGASVVPSTHMLYISYGGDGGANGTGSLLKYDLLADTVVWTQNYTHGIDSFAITPDGSTIYMPDGVNSTDGLWYLVDAVTGNELGSISTGLSGPHNTVASLDGAYVYGGPRYSGFLAEMSTASKTDVLNIGPLNPSVRPFSINGKHTLAFTTASNASGIGFQVSNTITGAVLYTVTVPGFTIPAGFAGDTPNHGISLSPDEKEIYLMDSANGYVHVYDVSGLPASAPVLVANIPLTTNFGGMESPCLYDCLREAWVHHTSDGHYVIVGDSGNVIDTALRQVVGNIPELLNSRRGFLEIDWQNGLPVFTTTHYGLGYVTQ